MEATFIEIKETILLEIAREVLKIFSLSDHKYYAYGKALHLFIQGILEFRSLDYS